MLAEHYEFPEAEVVTGGFPCQDFSHAGKRQGFDADRGTLYQSFVELVRRVKPVVFVAENVNGLLTMPGNPIAKIISDFTEVGYQVKYQLVKSEEFGIPQTRWRVIIMGLRNDRAEDLPDDWNVIRDNRRSCFIRPYFAHLQEPDTTTDPAQQVYSKAAKLEKGQGQKAVGLDEFAPTMRAEHHGNIEFRRHGEGERRLTVREAALIQTFPPTCLLTKPNKKATGKAYKPIGNAVPPLLGYLVARKVREILDSSSVQTLPPT
jgi:DNA (cytosine-5)-methyltransferase 1